ncbi:MAG TPA: oligosaccharide flippase family protein, partial [Pyrinomonadaceae bacterium]|nr:oligosaccharide flippase family protein [Pyrinomonadaceae bacterium]
MASDKEPSAPSGHDVRRSAGWDIATAPKNYAVLLGSHFATALLSFTTVWVINKRAGAGAYGGLIAFIAVSQLIQVFLNWSLASLTRFGIEEFVETGHVTRSFWSRTLIFVPNLAVALALSPLWLGPLASAFKIPEEVSWLILVHIVATAAWLHVQYTLQSAKMMRLTGVLLVVERVLVLTLVLGSLYGPGLNATNILWCFIIPPAVMVVVGLVISAKYIGLAKIVDLPQLRTMVRFSLPLIPFTIISYFATSQLDAYFLNNYLTTADLGIYSIATQISGIVVQIPVLANTLLLS